MSNHARVNRRQFERFMLEPGYTSAALRVHPDEQVFTREGHIYDISEGGVCFEMDQAIEPGSTVSMRVDLPMNANDLGPGRSVFLTGNIVWCDADEMGAVRMALAITRFDRAGDKGRMMRALTGNRNLRAA
jgi:hypothetical protein